MLDRLKRALVDSFIGAIALGYVLAQIIWHFAGIFASPVVAWLLDKHRQEFASSIFASPTLSPEDALPDLIRFLLLLLIWYVLLRWLYLEPLKKGSSDPAQNREEADRPSN